jgi:hypothetical protein
MAYKDITSGQYIVAAHPPSPVNVIEGLLGCHGPRTASVRGGILAACLVALLLPGLLPAAASSMSSDEARSGMGLVLGQVCDDVPYSIEGAFADAVTGLVTVRPPLTTLLEQRD